MNVPELLSAIEKVIDKGQRANVKERRTVDAYTVPRFGALTQEVNEVLAYLRSEARTSRSVATRLPLMEAKWAKCRAEKGNRRQMKIESRQAYFCQQAASRRARRTSIETVEAARHKQRLTQFQS